MSHTLADQIIPNMSLSTPKEEIMGNNSIVLAENEINK